MHLKDALNTFKNAFKMHFLNGEIKCISNYAGMHKYRVYRWEYFTTFQKVAPFYVKKPF